MKLFLKQISLSKSLFLCLFLILATQVEARWSGQVVSCTGGACGSNDGCLVRDCDGATFCFNNNLLSANPPSVGDRVIYNEIAGVAELLDYVTTYVEITNGQTLVGNQVLGNNSVLVIHGGGTLDGSADLTNSLCYLAGGSLLHGSLHQDGGDLWGKPGSQVDDGIYLSNSMNVVSMDGMDIYVAVEVINASPITLANSNIYGNVLANKSFFVDIRDNNVTGDMTVRQCYGFDMQVHRNIIDGTMTVSSNSSDGTYTDNEVGNEYLVAYNTGLGISFAGEDIYAVGGAPGSQLLKIFQNSCGINFDHFDLNGKLVVTNNSGTLGLESFTVENGLSRFDYNTDELYIEEATTEKVRIWYNDGPIQFLNSFPNDNVNIKYNTDQLEVNDVETDGNTVIKFNADVFMDGGGSTGSQTSTQNSGLIGYYNLNIGGNMTSTNDGDLEILGCDVTGDLTINCTPVSCTEIGNTAGSNTGCPSCKTGNAAASLEEQIDNPALGLQLYPNPSEGQFTIQLEESGAAITSIGTFDLRGRVVQNKVLNLTERSAVVDLSGAVPGIYFIKITTSKGQLQPTKMVIH